MCDVEIIADDGAALLEDPAWDAFVDVAGTPFHSRRFLLAWWRHAQAGNPASRLVAVKFLDGLQTIGVCALESADGLLSFAGGRDTVDYMGPVSAEGREKEVAAALTRWAFAQPTWTRAYLAGLPAGDAMTRELGDAVLRHLPHARIETCDQAPAIECAPGGYLPSLTSKRRADVLRKRNRLIEEVGELRLEASTPETLPQALGRLLAWKAVTGTERQEFVAEYGPFLRHLLGSLAPDAAGHIVELWAGARPLASAIVLSHRTTTYLYNMSYDPAVTSGAGVGLSPGIVLVSYLAEQSFERGRRFDFLKGAQDYKLRLGGVPRDLTAITVER